MGYLFKKIYKYMFIVKIWILVYGIFFFYLSYLDKMNKLYYRKGIVILINLVWLISVED